MSKIIEELQVRSTEAKKKLDEATAALQAAQTAHGLALQNFNVWNLALQIETRDEQQRQAAAIEKQLPLPETKSESMLVIDRSNDDDVFVVDDLPDMGVTKTDIVRNLLRQHPGGMTAPDIWKQVRSQFQHRPYLYSILKRLRDREEVAKRRGKYFLKLEPKIEEVKDQQSIVH